MKIARLSIVHVLIVMLLPGCDSAPKPLPVANPNPGVAADKKMSPVRIAPGTNSASRGPSVSHDDY